jgi:uncharacterized protein (DUF2267 family)
MRTVEEVLHQFAYHPATPATAPVFDQLRSLVSNLAEDTWDLIPDGPEKTLAYRDLQRFLQAACLAVALTTPVDADTAHVARVLPAVEDVDV